MKPQTNTLSEVRTQKIQALSTVNEVESAIANLNKVHSLVKAVLIIFAVILVPVGLIAFVIPGLLFSAIFWFLWKMTATEFSLELKAHKDRMKVLTMARSA